MNFIEKSLKYRQVTLSVLFLFFAVGVYSLFNMSRREDPRISIPQGLVVAYYPGASSMQVEEQVTKKLEEYLFKYEEVNREKTWSASQDGKVVINVELKSESKDHDIFWSKLRQQLLVAKQVDLPQGVMGPIVNSDFGDTEAMIFGISGKGQSYDQLNQYARQLEEMLRAIPEVSKIKRSGDIDEQILVTANTAQMAQYDLKLPEVIRILQSQNDIYPTGDIDLSGVQVPLYTRGFYNTQEELANQIIGTSRAGSIVRLKDIAILNRTYAEPASKIKVDDEKALIVSVQMQAGKNVVKAGDKVREKLEQFKRSVPSGVTVTTIVDQPSVVSHNVNNFLHEFLLAIISVVIVIILMLPINIALVSALAIPMTISLTLGLMNLLGIELHQVSLASLIVVLGMVVDDAIVVADNYVELLDKGMNRWEAAWKSASELVVPIFVATLTIIFAFIPMVMLSGTVGEFIRAMPLTVSIALASSFIVAMFFTPLLCYTFIRKGVHTPDASGKKKRVSLLDSVQKGYNQLLDRCTSNPRTTAIIGLLPMLLAVMLYKFGIKQKFFPEAERNQFVIELWMPTGTNLDATEKAIEKIEALFRNDERVVNYNSFIGSSAPRFYYNFSPEFPVTNYAQILLNTTDTRAAEVLTEELANKIEQVVPEGSPQVRLMQQGKPLKAPVEVRIWGDNIVFLKNIAQQVDSIIRNTRGSAYVRDDFKEDYFGLDIRLKPEAERLGFTTEAVAKAVYTGFAGAHVTTIREGNKAVKVVFQLEENARQSTNDINRFYLVSPATGAHVPLSQIAELKPVWKTGRIMHRNGVRVLTVQSNTQDKVLPSELLKAIKPEIARLELPEGYVITYGGEDQNQRETFPEMIGVLGISLILIFFTLLFQFRNLKEAGIIMLTIPLAMFGAMLGLFVTGNNFGFTAFVGIISLSGVVVRNAIILIDHIHELVRDHGMDLRTATIETGKRRFRPIFLTAMAAAFGVLPMILSGSPMWSPLASVIAFGVVIELVNGLLCVPAFYLLWVVPKSEKKKS
ncbi:MAG TPA: efflux RND transporter permease subunit [Flavihumibacter sp.]